VQCKLHRPGIAFTSFGTAFIHAKSNLTACFCVCCLQRRPWEFDEMRDTVDYDLIVVMDRYDRQEVEREVGLCVGRCLWLRLWLSEVLTEGCFLAGGCLLCLSSLR
jgi:hypothetical protein